MDEVACKILLGFFSGAFFIMFYFETQQNIRGHIAGGALLYFLLFGGLLLWLAINIMR